LQHEVFDALKPDEPINHSIGDVQKTRGNNSGWKFKNLEISRFQYQ